MDMISQEKIVLHHLRTHKGLTSYEAFVKYQITRLSAHILNLRKDGYQIDSIWEHNDNTGTRFVRYVLMGEPKKLIKVDKCPFCKKITPIDIKNYSVSADGKMTVKGIVCKNCKNFIPYTGDIK